MSEQKSYRQLQDQLDQVLTELQSVELDIDKALDLYNQGEKLIKEIESYLTTAKNRIEDIKK